MRTFVALLHHEEHEHLLTNVAGRPLISYVLRLLQRTDACEKILLVTKSRVTAQVARRLRLSKLQVVAPPTDKDSHLAEIRAIIAAAGYGRDQVLLLIRAGQVCLLPQDLAEAFVRLNAYGADNLVASSSPVATRAPKMYERDELIPAGTIFRFCTFQRLLVSPPYERTRGYVVPAVRALEYQRGNADLHLAVEAILRARRRLLFDPQPIHAVKLFLTDVDGTLTDSGMYYTESGDELKKFNTRDGKGLQRLREAGMQVGIITGENRELVQRRADKLGLDHCFLGIADKVPVVQALLDKLDLDWSQVAFIGDDLNDTALLERVGVSAVPADAIARNLEMADFVCELKGGEGCVREFAEHLLQVRN